MSVTCKYIHSRFVFPTYITPTTVLNSFTYLNNKDKRSHEAPRCHLELIVVPMAPEHFPQRCHIVSIKTERLIYETTLFRCCVFPF